MAGARTCLGSDHDLGSRRKIYKVKDALEVDEVSGNDVERSRVYFDDVLAMTFHRTRSWVLLLLTGFFCLVCFGSIVIAVAAGASSSGGILVVLILCLPLAITFLHHLFLGVDVITVYGRRTMARMKFGWAKARAQRVLAELTREIRVRQAALAASMAPPAVPAPPAGEVLPPPPPAAAL